MKRFPDCLWMAPSLLLACSLPAGAAATETLEKYRASFEKRMNQELDEQGNAARDLRGRYLEALKKLKVELGRAENLKGAAQVVDEIEMIEDGEETEDLPQNADPKFRRVRQNWERGLTEIRTARNKKLNTTVNLYLKALDTEKRRLTRAGKIKDALLFEDEEKRVKGLPEVKAMTAVPETNRPTDPRDLALFSNGARASGANEERHLIDGKIRHSERGGFAWGKIPCTFDVDLGAEYTLNRIRILLYEADNRRYGYRLLVSPDAEIWKEVQSASKAKSWQEIELKNEKVRYIRIKGSDNTENRNFHVVEVEAYGS